MIIKLEGDIRNHIRVEQQLKLHIESLQFQADEADRLQKVELEDLRIRVSELEKKSQEKDKTIYQLRAELNEKEKPLKEKAAALKAMEAKIISMEERHEKELEQVK